MKSLAFALLSLSTLHAADAPQWGQAWTRNMVSAERGLPDSFDPGTARNIRWVAKLGTETHSTPVISGGRVFIGTNNEVPRDPLHTGDRGVLMCFDEKDGRLLWQLVAPKREEDPYLDWPKAGMSSPATVEGERAYMMTNRGEVLCVDVAGKPGQITRTEADAVWKLDLTADAGIWSHDAAHSSILIHGPYLYLNTGTGVDNSHRRIRTPDAPSLIVIEKATGRLVARDDAHIAPRIFHCTWSSPSLAEVNGRALVFFAGGDGIVRAFEPIAANPPAGEVAKLREVWHFDIDPTAPKEDVHRFTSNRQQGPSNIFGMPVFSAGRIFVAGGGDVWWGKNEAWLKCIDATKTGDVTATGEVWSYPLGRHVMSTVAVHEGMIFIADHARTVHCLDAATGKPHWTHDMKGEFWASPFVADGKVFIGTRKGDFAIFAASKEKQVLATIDFKRPISATATAANGVLYIATMSELYAIEKK